MKKIAVALAGLAGLASLALADAPPAGKPAIGPWGFDLTGMDTSVKPGDDFFEYANGNWFKRTTIPSDRTSIGSFQELRILSEQRMKDLIADLHKKDPATLTPEEHQVLDLYDAFTDTTQIEARGLKPIEGDLKRIAALKTLSQIAALMGDPAFPNFADRDSIVGSRIDADPKNSHAYVVFATQAGLGMPNRDYYLDTTNPDLANARVAYLAYLESTLALTGAKHAHERAAAVFKLENDLAVPQWTPAQSRDADKTYNPMTVADLAKFAPGFDWIAFYRAQGIAPDRKVIARQNTAFPAMAKVFAATPVGVWKDYLTIHYIHAMEAYLPKKVDDVDFAFYGKVVGGQDQQLPRDTLAVQLIDATLTHPFGKLYAAKYFPPETRVKAEELVANIVAAYDADIRTITWMRDVTRQKALAKLHAFTPHIGYPDHWRDFSGLIVKRDDLTGDMKRATAFEWQYRLARIDGPVVRDEWNMTPPTVNAYYTQSLNSIFFPAAILQPPFFDPNADDAVNYGGIGVVIGHEIGHGFDDQGSKYTGDGNLESWWTDADRKAFEERVSMLGAQYDSYEGLPGLHLRGRQTMGENIGDLSGVAIALKAYHMSLGGKPAPVLDGFTGDQRFFLSFGQIWRGKYTDAAMRLQVLANPHSPPHWRAVGPERNVDAWYDAFGVKPGDKYYLAPDQRVHLW
ncbi:MAG TPA: M13 family metallopeptidase [Rhizomicrobium sp.]|nr:M13 family metallopeptidase [Rhizomicrobium sp.]